MITDSEIHAICEEKNLKERALICIRTLKGIVRPYIFPEIAIYLKTHYLFDLGRIFILI